jgi:hypothetical protein
MEDKIAVGQYYTDGKEIYLLASAGGKVGFFNTYTGVSPMSSLVHVKAVTNLTEAEWKVITGKLDSNMVRVYNVKLTADYMPKVLQQLVMEKE